jgi:hypothetical protein
MKPLLSALLLILSVTLANSYSANAQSGAPSRITLTRAQVMARVKPFGFKYVTEKPFGNGRHAWATIESEDGDELASVSVTTLQGRIVRIFVSYRANLEAPFNDPQNHLEDFKAISAALFPKWVEVPALIDSEFEKVVSTAINEDDSESLGIRDGNVRMNLFSDVTLEPEFTLAYVDIEMSNKFKSPNFGDAGAASTIADTQAVPTLIPEPAPTQAPVAAAVSGGSVAPSGEWTCPDSHPIKGNRDSMIYHVPGGRYFNRTKPEECFASESDAVAAGYRAPKQ